ncbi:hypothetical protein BCR39DRAFT_539048 [Naematelia encephala]|uniref:Ribosome biogenesis protein NSA1 n=1 Tax=Naematelia encephala TaxID=71784 RepID=A0A1Y2AXK0_9TREE|nr:hypothetical protein BCR39DRAFT_539048 [Naematelia encephala]
MVQTLDFLAPSLHPNTLVDISYPEPGPSFREPIVRHLAVKHGEYKPLGRAKNMILDPDDHLVVADDSFLLSRLKLSSPDEPAPPEIVSQHQVQGKKGDIFTGLIHTQAGTIASLSSGLLTLVPTSADSEPISRTVPSPLLCLSSSSSTAASFALAGKEVDVSIYDIERTFSSAPALSDPSVGGIKRKNAPLEPGEIWRAKNMPLTSLSLRPPIHHLALAHLLQGPEHLVSGTKAGTVRRYDTRQRKPVAEWKVAREGGVGSVTPRSEHELFFSDRSSFLGAIDLRTGRLLYSYPKLTSSAYHLLSIPSPPPSASTSSAAISISSQSNSSVILGLASISSDATLRIHSTVPPLPEGVKGNAGGEKKKASVVGSVGGVGVGGFVFRRWGNVPDLVEVQGEGKTQAQGEEGEEEEDEGDVWDGMSEVLEDGDSDLDSDEEEVEDDQVAKKQKKSKR